MTKLLTFYRYVNALSIDIALGSVCCAAWFAGFFNIPLRPYALMGLGVTVWIIYTADHLLDARKIEGEASTDRHRFHQRYFTTLSILLLLASVVDVVLTLFIRREVFIAGIALACIVGIYLLFNRWLSFYKDFFVAVLYAAGVLLPAISLGGLELLWKAKFIVISFFLTVLINVILFSLYDVQSDQQDRHNSFSMLVGTTTTRWFLSCLFIAQGIILSLVLSQATIPAIVLFVMNLVLALLFVRTNVFKQRDTFRLLGDAIFLFPVLFIPFS